MKCNCKKVLSVFLALMFVFGFGFVNTGHSFGVAKAENTRHLYQVGTIGVMPDDYIGSITLNTANTVEDDYVSDWAFPMQGMTVDANGDLIVTDPEYGRIHVLDKTLQNKLTFGELGKGPGKLQYPADVAVDKDGNFYVADFFNNYWAKFDKTGKWIMNVGKEGSGDGEFNGPAGIAIGPDGNVYVSDQLNSRIEVFTKDGKFVKELSTTLISYPGAITFSPDGNLLVVSIKMEKVVVLSTDGSVVSSFGGKGTTNGRFIDPFDIAVDKDGNIYVADRGIGKAKPSVQKFDKTGKFLTRIGHKATNLPQPNGSFLTPSGIAVDKDGNVYVFDAGYFYNSGGGPRGGPNPFGYPVGARLTVYDSQGNYVAKKDFDVMAPGRLVGSWSATVDSQGKVWATSWNNFSDTGEVDIFTKDGKFVKAIKGINSKEKFTAIGGIIADGKGHVFVGLANYIAEFDENGNFITKIGNHKVSSVDQMAFDPDGNLWCASYGTQTIVGFKPDGTFIKQFGLAKAAVGLAIDKDGNFYCLASDEGKVYVYTKDGKRSKSFGGTGREEGKFWYPQGLAIGPNGEILVADTENGRIQAFSKDGKFLWSTDRSYYEPMMMNWGPDGNLYLADGFHSVVRILSTKPPKVSNYNFIVKPSLSVLEVKAGKSGSFNFIIKNTGKTDDTYVLKLDSSDLPKGWKVSSIPDSVSVKAGDQTLIPVTVTTTPDSQPKEKGTLTLNVQSKGDPTLTKSSSVVVQIPERPPVNVTISGDTIPYNEQGTVTVDIEKTEGLYGVAITLNYDPDMLRVDKVEPSGVLGNDALFLENHSKPGVIVIGYTLKGKENGKTVVGPLVKITFTGLKIGKTTLKFSNVTLNDAKGHVIKSQTTDKDITVYDTTPPKIKVDFTDGTEVTDPNFYFSGSTDPGCQVTINGNSVEVNSDGGFVGSVYLNDGENTITIVSVNKYGVKNTLVLHVILKTKTVITLQPNNPYMTVNGVKKEIDPGRGTKPVIIPKWGRTVVPIRAIVEALGGTISWNGKEREVTINFKDTVINLWIGKPQAEVNGEMKWIDPNNHDVKPIIVNGRTMLPLRFVAENLGCKVDWDPNTKTITITYPAG